MKNFLKIVSVYVGVFFHLSAHVWPIFDCYSNMPFYPAMTAFTDQYSLPNIFFDIGQL
jgi:hypothetical protein